MDSSIEISALRDEVAGSVARSVSAPEGDVIYLITHLVAKAAVS